MNAIDLMMAAAARGPHQDQEQDATMIEPSEVAVTDPSHLPLSKHLEFMDDTLVA